MVALFLLFDQVTSSVGLPAESILKLGSKLGIRLAIDIISVFILIRFIYYPIYKSRELFFTFFIFNLIIFLVSFLLNKVDLSMGTAFGLFAVFSMLRYRTEDISSKDMSYLFLVIAIGLVSAITNVSQADELAIYLLLGGIISVLLLITFLLESSFFYKKENFKVVYYENLDLIGPKHREALLNDLRERTGLQIHRLSFTKIDYVKKSVQIRIYYYEEF
jgi:hypothetical protein